VVLSILKAGKATIARNTPKREQNSLFLDLFMNFIEKPPIFNPNWILAYLAHLARE
jgi:hypothetical protein